MKKTSVLFFLLSCSTFAADDARLRLSSPWVVGRDLLALDSERDAVVGQKPKGEWATIFQRKGCDPAGLSSLPEGELALACEREKSVVFFYLDGRVLRVVKDNQDGEDLTPPQRLTFGSDGALFFTASSPLRTEVFQRNGRLYWIPPGQQNAWAISTSLGFPQGLLIEKDSKHVLIAERTIGRVTRYELHGSTRSFNRRLRKPRVLFDFRKTVGEVGELLAPGPSGLAWAGESSFWVSCVGDARIREISVNDGRILQEFEIPGRPQRISHLVVDKTRKVLWFSTEKGIQSIPIPAASNSDS